MKLGPYLVFSLFLYSLTPQAQPLLVSIYRMNDVANGDVKRVEEGLGSFLRSLSDSCQLRLELNVSHVTLPAYIFRYDGSEWIDREVAPRRNFPFLYYQHSVYQLTRRHHLVHRKNEISIFLTRNLERHCGFAHPPVQFISDRTKHLSRTYFEQVVPWISNRVLLAAPSGNLSECGNYSRLVAHELAHILVQDHPPHHCLSENGKTELCAPENLLAAKDTYPEYHPHRHWERRDDDPFMDYSRPARGTALNRQQCMQIRRSLEILSK